MSTRDEGSRAGTTASPGRAREPGPGAPLRLAHAEMDGARSRGEARPLAGGITWIARYRGAWWVAYERCWLRVTDTPLHDDLDRIASRLAAAESAAARNSVLARALQVMMISGEADEIGEQA